MTPSGCVGVAGDAEQALVVEAVVVPAQADQVPGHGLAVVFPVDDVVDLDPQGGVAAGDPAAAVAVLDQPADPPRHDPLGPPDLDGVAVGVPDRGDVAVAGEVAAHGRRQGGAHVQLGPPPLAVDRAPAGGPAPRAGTRPRRRRRRGSARCGPSPPARRPTPTRRDPELGVGARRSSRPSASARSLAAARWASWSRSRDAFSASSTTWPSSTGSRIEARHWSDPSVPNDTDRTGPGRSDASRSTTSASKPYHRVARTICGTVAFTASSHTDAS